MSSKKESKDPMELVAQIRSALHEEINAAMNDFDICRFLVARNLNVEKSLEMINKWYVWYTTPFTDFEISPEKRALRPMDLVDGITDEKEALFGELFPFSNIGEDKQGRPIYWEKSGFVARGWSKIRQAFTDDELILRHIGQQNHMTKRRFAQAAEKHNKHINKQVVVMDLKGLPMAPEWAALKNLHRVITLDQDFFPETLGLILVINAPYYFTVIWAVVKPWLDPMVLEKVNIVGSNYQDVLKTHIDEQYIPVEFGGSCEYFAWKTPENNGI
eukprot:gene27297-32969_t